MIKGKTPHRKTPSGPVSWVIIIIRIKLCVCITKILSLSLYISLYIHTYTWPLRSVCHLFVLLHLQTHRCYTFLEAEWALRSRAGSLSLSLYLCSSETLPKSEKWWHHRSWKNCVYVCVDSASPCPEYQRTSSQVQHGRLLVFVQDFLFSCNCQPQVKQRKKNFALF